MSSTDIVMAAAGASPAVTPEYVEDVFSTWLYTGNGLTQPIENGIALSNSNSGGSVSFDGAGDVLVVSGNAAFRLDADFTIEGWVYPTTQVQQYPAIITVGAEFGAGNFITLYFNHAGNPGKYLLYVNDAQVIAGTIAPGSNVWHHFALTRSGNTWRLFVNGVLDTTATRSGVVFSSNPPVTIASESATRAITDFTGYISNVRIVKDTAIYTSSFTPSTAALTAITNTSLLVCQGDTPFKDNSSNNFTVTQNGNVTARKFGPFTAAGANNGGLVWIKQRNGTLSHVLTDSERGVDKAIFSNLNIAQQTGQTYITSFNSNGFSVGGLNATNESAINFTSWTFRKAPKFFDVVTYTGDGTTYREIDAPNLQSTNGSVFIKCTSTTGDWQAAMYSEAFGGAFYLRLNSTSAKENSFGGINTNGLGQYVSGKIYLYGGNTGVSNVNASGQTYIAYIFAHNAGGFGDAGTDNIISCGGYTGTGVTGNVVTLGFEPQFILIKNTNSLSDWVVVDTMRQWSNTNASILIPNTSGDEYSQFNISPNATGFELRSGNLQFNATDAAYVYIAIRRPMKKPTSGTEVFTPLAYTGNNAFNRKFTTNFVTDALFVKSRSGTVSTRVHYRLGGDTGLDTTTTNAESVNSIFPDFDYNDGWDNGEANGTAYNASGSTYIAWNFRRATGFFDVVCYTGTGSARTVAHNLGVAPELMIVKQRNTTRNWVVYSSETGATKYILLNTSDGSETNSLIWNDTSPTSSVFTVGSSSSTNASGGTYVAYLFASLPGVSKVGSYTSNGATTVIDCGFTTGARFVLIKRTDAAGSWFVWDTARGIVSGNDPYLLLNSTAAEVTNSDRIDPASSGFELPAGTSVNTSGESYIYLAIA